MRSSPFLGALVLLVPLVASLGSRELPSIGTPALACTGAPRFSRDALVIVPAEGAVAPRNTRVLFFGGGGGLFATRPTQPAELRTASGAVPLAVASSIELRPPRLEPNASYELWLPDGLGPPWGRATPKLERARTFRTSGEDDTTPPRLRTLGTPIRHPAGPTSCDRGPTIELPVDVEDASPAFVEVDGYVQGSKDDRSTTPTRAAINGGRIRIDDFIFPKVGGSRLFATHLVVTPVDIAGNRGGPQTIALGRLADGGDAFHEAAPGPRSRGCGKY